MIYESQVYAHLLWVYLRWLRDYIGTFGYYLIILAYRTGQSVDLTVIGNPVFTLSRDLPFPYHMINRTKGLNGAYVLFRRLQYL